jgi:hypothetical protein
LSFSEANSRANSIRFPSVSAERIGETEGAALPDAAAVEMLGDAGKGRSTAGDGLAFTRIRNRHTHSRNCNRKEAYSKLATKKEHETALGGVARRGQDKQTTLTTVTVTTAVTIMAIGA